MVYTVDYIMHGHYTVEVEADSIEEAKSKSELIFSEADFGEASNIDGDLYWIEDEEPLDDMVYPADNFDSSYEDEYHTILEVIQSHYPQVKGFVLKNINDISWDHQTMPYESDFVITLWDEAQIEGYLFNDSVKVVVGRD